MHTFPDAPARDPPTCTELHLTSAGEVRRTIAHAVLGADAAGAVLGEITLMPHQREAAARLWGLVGRDGGALLADEAGLGKTYVALELIARARHPIVILPAALRSVWTAAMERAGVIAPLCTYEALSRSPPRRGDHDLVVLDEAHHARNPATRRYDAIVELTRGARVLLITATPIHNSVRDLRALLALFLGSIAAHMPEGELARFVVRRGRADIATGHSLPALRQPEWLRLADDARVLDALLALPPPLPPSDGGDGGALVTLTLVRLWASSRAALRAALRRRLSRAIALEESLAAGRHPGRAELARWVGADDVLQLAFPGMINGASVPDDAAMALKETLADHARGLRTLLALLGRNDAPDAERAAALAAVRRRHPGERVLAFTQFAETARAMYVRLRGGGRCAALTARGALVSDGRVARRDVIAAFAPAATGVAPPAAAFDITLLIATDLLSEGMNLQDASVVVHLDLPWTAARLEQRVGRARRVGSSHLEVTVYALAPPVEANELLQVEERLRDKLLASGRTLGAERLLLPPDLSAAIEPSPAECEERIRRLLANWRREDPPHAIPQTLVGAARASRGGWIAAVDADGERRLLGGDDEQAASDPLSLLPLLNEAGGASAPITTGTARRALRRVYELLAHESAASACGLGGYAVSLSRLAALRRVAEALRRAPLHRRAAVSLLAERARRVLLGRLGAGEERALQRLHPGPDHESWLKAVAALSATSGTAPTLQGQQHPRVVALLLLIPESHATAAPHAPEPPLS